MLTMEHIYCFLYIPSAKQKLNFKKYQSNKLPLKNLQGILCGFQLSIKIFIFYNVIERGVAFVVTHYKSVVPKECTSHYVTNFIQAVYTFHMNSCLQELCVVGTKIQKRNTFLKKLFSTLILSGIYLLTSFPPQFILVMDSIMVF